MPPLFGTLRKKKKQFSSFFIYFSCCPCVREFGRSHTRKSGQQLLVSPSFRPATHRCAPSPFELVQPPPNPSTRGGKKELRVCVLCTCVSFVISRFASRIYREVRQSTTRSDLFISVHYGNLYPGDDNMTWSSFFYPPYESSFARKVPLLFSFLISIFLLSRVV